MRQPGTRGLRSGAPSPSHRRWDVRATVRQGPGGMLRSCPPPLDRPVAARPRPGRQPRRGERAGDAPFGAAATHGDAAARRRRTAPRRPVPADVADRQRHGAERPTGPAAPRPRPIRLPARADWTSRPKPDTPAPRPTTGVQGQATASASTRGRRSLQGPQPRLDPGPRHRPVGLVVRVLVVGLPGQPRVPLGLRRRQQRLPVRSRPQRVQGPPRRLRPRPAREGHEGLLRRRRTARSARTRCRGGR